MLSSRFNKLDPYVPGEQPKDRIYIKLNANENPYPPSPFVKEAIKDLVDKNLLKMALYPDPDSSELRKAIASMLNKTGGIMGTANVDEHDNVTPAKKLPFEVTPEMIFCGNGSDEVLSFLFYAFFSSESPLIAPEFSYSFYPVYCGYYNIPLKKVPLAQDFSLNTKQMLNETKKNFTGMIFANPNAPTSISLSVKEIKHMLDNYPKDKAFVVDEAYVDFSDETVLPLLKDYKNLIIVRTFSKSMSFAGMRLGYIIADPEYVNAMTRVKNSFNHFPGDVVMQTSGIAACSDPAYYVKNTKKIIKTRENFKSFILKEGFIVLNSKTNFLFVKKENMSGHDLYEHAKKDGLLIRHFNTPGISDYVRITIGTDEQMAALIESLVNF